MKWQINNVLWGLFLCGLFTSCRWECQSISEEDLPWFIAEDYKCQAVLFTNGKDTVALTYDNPEITHGMDKTFAMERGYPL